MTGPEGTVCSSHQFPPHSSVGPAAGQLRSLSQEPHSPELGVDGQLAWLLGAPASVVFPSVLAV